MPTALGDRHRAHRPAGCASSARTFTATHLVLAAGTWGTQKLLFKMRDTGTLPKLSDQLGVLTRTNSESIVGAGRLQARPTSTSPTAWRSRRRSTPPPTPTSNRCRYGKGSNAMGLLQTLMTDGPGPGGTDVPRWKQLLSNAGDEPARHAADARRAALERAHHDLAGDAAPGQLDHHLHQEAVCSGMRRMTSKQGHGEPNPTWIPVGNEVTRRIAEKIDGVAGGTWGELFNIPLTAHFLGGAAIGDSPETRCHRPVSPGVRLPDAARDGRRGDLGQPRRQPVAVDHRPGRAGRVAVAQQGRAGPASGAGPALPAAGARSRRRTRWCPRRAGGAASPADRTGQLSPLA